MNKLMMSTLIAAGLATAAPLTMAQPENPSAGAPQSQHVQRHHHGKQAFSLPGERVEARLAYLKTALKITDTQQAQWDAFAGVMRNHAKNADERIKMWKEKTGQRTGHKRPTAIERLERRQERLAAASTRLSELLAVEKPLYAALSPEQQQTADKVLAGRSHGGFRHNGRHGKA
jgi:hypothetical protein